MGDNLLQNPGFEADWSEESSHRCLVIPADGAPYQTDIGNIFSPPKWLPFFYHDPGTFDQPEVRDAWASDDERRAHSGQKGILLFTYSRKHVAGFLQQVQVAPGTRLRLSAWAHAWSNHMFGHNDDPWWSEGAEWAPRNEHHEYPAIPVQNWHLQGTPGLDDNWRNFTFKIGIDVSGGLNPFNARTEANPNGTVIYSAGIHIYNEYVQVPAVEAVAEAGTVTVILRSVTLWPFEHNDAYWDDAALVLVPQPPVAEFSWSCDGLACEFDGSASHDPDGTIVLHTWDMGDGYLYQGGVVSHAYAEAGTYDVMLTVMDDDGLTGSVTHSVTVSDEPPSPPPSECRLPIIVPYLEDIHAAAVEAGTALEKVIAAVGGMIDAIEEIPPVNLPPEVSAGPDQTITLPAAASLSGTVTDDGLPDPPGIVFIQWSKVSGPGAVTFADETLVDTTATFSEAGSYVLELRAADGELTGYDQVTVRVEEASPPEEPPWAGMIPISLHVQKPVADPSGYGDLEFARDVQPAGFKTVGYMEALQRVKQVSPKTVTAHRQFVENQDEFIDVPDGPRRFLYTHLDSLNALRNSVDLDEGLNEIWVPNQLEQLAEWYWYFAEALAAEGSPAAPLVGSIPVGNPPLVSEGGRPYIEAMLQMVEAAVQYGGAVGYHGYHRCSQGAVDPAWPENWLYYAGRFTDWDPIFNEHGLYPNYFISESGAFLNALAGWAHADVFAGQFPPYGQSLLELRNFIDTWNAEHNWRTICYTLFTYLPPGQGWQYFNLYGHARELAETLTGGPVGGPTLYTRLKRTLDRFGIRGREDVAGGKWEWTGRDPRERYMNGG